MPDYERRFLGASNAEEGVQHGIAWLDLDLEVVEMRLSIARPTARNAEDTSGRRRRPRIERWFHRGRGVDFTRRLRFDRPCLPRTHG
jgi:hypothetical protein